MSVELARLATRDDREGAFRVYRRVARKPTNAPWKVKQDVLLARLRWHENRILFDLRKPEVKEVIVDAVDRNDRKFFLKLGRILSRPAKKLDVAATNSGKLKQFLLNHWAEACDDLPELFYLTPSDVAEICADHLGFEVDESRVVKLRQRLKLKLFGYKLFRLKHSSRGYSIYKVDNN